MPSSQKEKNSANSRAKRHSISSQSKKGKKKKDSDTASISSSTKSDSTTDTAHPEARCPLRFMLIGMMQRKRDGIDTSNGQCPLRRVQLWHVLPLCTLAIINLLLVIIVLLGIAGYRISITVRDVVVKLAKVNLDCNPFAAAFEDTEDDLISLLAENK
ncbi:hypothetical protein B0O99DRAFT_683508 [Bisporella sp. PMI_857]|nr:hypothetical protein B0O99DRAFT_683508 [Bisporella sp. PMI_857]